MIEFCCTKCDMIWLFGWRVKIFNNYCYHTTFHNPHLAWLEMPDIFRVQVQELNGPLFFLSIHGTRAGMDLLHGENIRGKWGVEENIFCR